MDAPDKLTYLLSSNFPFLAELSERVAEDVAHLERQGGSEAANRNKAEFDRTITFSADFGLIFKDRLEISPAGVVWKRRVHKLDDIRSVRWGGTKHSVNGIPTGTTYQIFVASDQGRSDISLGNFDIYSRSGDCLWRAVGTRILFEYLERLRADELITFGDALIDDTTITLVRHCFFSSSEKVRLKWHDVQIWSAGGNFVIGAKADKKAYATLFYLNNDNIHVLENMIRMFFKTGKMNISSLLD